MGPRLGLLLCAVILGLVLLAQHAPRCGPGEQRSITVGDVVLLAGCRR